MRSLRAGPAIALAHVPATALSPRWWLFGAGISLLLHGAAAAALFLPWGEGREIEAGGVVVVDVVTFSGPSAEPTGAVEKATEIAESEALPINANTASPKESQRDAVLNFAPQLVSANAPQTPSPEPDAREPHVVDKISVDRPSTKLIGSDARAATPAKPETSQSEAGTSETIELTSTNPKPATEQLAVTLPPTPPHKPDLPREVRRETQYTEVAELPDDDTSSNEIARNEENDPAVETSSGAAWNAQEPPSRRPQHASLSENAEGPLDSASVTGASGGGHRGAAPLAGNPQPEYPYRARVRGWEGRVVLGISIDATGAPTDISVLESSGYGVLDQAARDAVSKWRFQPARRSGDTIATSLRLPVRFTLED